MTLVRKIYNRYFSPDRAFAFRLKTLLGFTPTNLSLYKLAFFHRSNQDLESPTIQSNERLEFLGDSILSTVVAEYLFKKYPSNDEGFLTKMRAKIVKRKTLNQVARSMELDIFLNELNSTKLSNSMLGNALEALIGAIYLDCGYAATHDYVVNCILKDYLDMKKMELWDDNFKSKLLEWGQKENHEVDYRLLKRFKQDKRDCFEVAVYIDKQRISKATDYNKKSAEQKASKAALLSMNLIDSSMQHGVPTTM